MTSSEHRDASSAIRDGCIRTVGFTAVDRALLRRFGDEGDDGYRTVAGSEQSGMTSFFTPVVPAIIHETPLLIPHAQPLPTTPPSGADTQFVYSRRADASFSTEISHSTPPIISTSPPDGTTGVKQEHSEQSEDGAVVCEPMDQDDSPSVKRRKVTGRYGMRAKEEVMDCSAPENPEIASTEVERVLMDTRASEHSGTQVESGTKWVATDESRAATGTEVDRLLMDDQVQSKA